MKRVFLLINDISNKRKKILLIEDNDVIIFIFIKYFCLVLFDNGSVDNDYDEDEFLFFFGLILIILSYLKLMFLY